ncbi:MAG: hypothetical protein ACLSVD_15600 [Eggerthellaceae bacterium]
MTWPYNVTMPLKALILPYLDSCPTRQAHGRLNTVVMQDGKAIGHNTDSAGFMRNLRRTAWTSSARR